MAYQFGERSKINRLGVDSRLIQISDLAIQITKIDFGIPADGGLRSAERQAELFEAGKSKADGLTRKSYHQSGRALDVYAYVDGQASWDENHLALVAAAMLQAASQLGHKVEWGGLWQSFVDMPHFQLSD